MKIQELKNDELLKIVEVSNHIKKPTIYPEETSNSVMVELKQIQMKIFTDGKIEKESEEIYRSIEEYYIGRKKYQYDVDTLKIKNILLKDYSFVIVYLIAREWITVGKITGWFDVIKDASIYLQDLKDKTALKKAKQVIKEIQNCNSRINYSSLFGILCSQENILELEKKSNNVFCLKK